MQSVDERDFLDWAGSQGIVLDQRYPRSSLLTFQDGPDTYVWPYPPQYYRRSWFLGVLLRLLEDWRTCYVWRHMGSWPAADEVDQLDGGEVVEQRIYAALGLPVGTADVLLFSREDQASLLTVMFCAAQFGWSVGQDIHVVPDHGRQFMMLSHHDAVDVHVRDPRDIENWTQATARFDIGAPVTVEAASRTSAST